MWNAKQDQVTGEHPAANHPIGAPARSIKCQNCRAKQRQSTCNEKHADLYQLSALQDQQRQSVDACSSNAPENRTGQFQFAKEHSSSLPKNTATHLETTKELIRFMLASMKPDQETQPTPIICSYRACAILRMPANRKFGEICFAGRHFGQMGIAAHQQRMRTDPGG